ncbi:4'-phosphopantetheinyl transferase family protein [Streptacidiphilus jiangxiensis]|uniref:4'-phosphopantetheinyl transferase n=1 Tax=Streptacidiphilus jiangxiensis TaxID=235985 RepID=A0A1H7IAQ4_STRJI|nr:4'-phosphopantetheinyl transferase superfamily protein [Streptacidiphilus jiangxiensis]SEK59424.1 4'-phosphopantetheinyl transferase [Streptacidiphilus jiangxiensis]
MHQIPHQTADGTGLLPPAGHRPARGVVELWLLRPDAAQLAAAERLLPLLDAEERARIDRCGDDERRASLLASHVSLRLLLGAYLGQAPDQVRVERAPCRGCGRPHGRPVVGAEPGLHFSLSHTNGMALLAFASTPVGVDVESLASVPGTELVPLLHPAEQRAIRALPPEDQERAFLHCFVRKEAYLKGTGDGLWAELDSFCVGFGGHGPSTLEPSALEPWAFAQVATEPTHGAAVALLMSGAVRPRMRRRDVQLPDWAMFVTHQENKPTSNA